MAVVDVVKRKTLDDSQTPVVLVGVKHFFELFLPLVGLSAILEKVLELLGS